MSAARDPLAVLISFSGEGGVERMLLNLLDEFAARAIDVDLLPLRRHSLKPERLPPCIRVVDLGARHALTGVVPLARYLRRTRPRALLVAKDRAARAALLARRLARVDTRVVVRLGTHLSGALASRAPLLRALRVAPMRRLYAGADHVIAVSAGVAEDVRRLTGLPQERVSVVANPVITPSLQRLAAMPSPHSWFEDSQVPVILGAGRLTDQKDFATLIAAFARLRRSRPCRLVILGEGAQRPALEAQARALQVQDAVLLPGHQTNPYAWMARAAVFALSSRWEGSPNVLTEALALGVPAVATDCPSGPREILRAGALGSLSPVGDAAALAQALATVLSVPLPASVLRAGVAEYNVERSAQRYLELLGIEPPLAGESSVAAQCSSADQDSTAAAVAQAAG